MSSTGYMYRYSTTTLVLLNFNVYSVFHDSWLTISNHAKISIKVLTLNNQHAEFPINWFWVVWRRVLIFFTLLEVWKIKRTFCNHVCMSQRAVFNWSNNVFYILFFLSDSTADTSIIEDCPDPYAIIDTTTPVYPTKGNHSILV